MARPLLGSGQVNPSIKLLPLPDRPRERLLRSGPTELTDTELVALVFGGDLRAASLLVGQLGGVFALGRATVFELCEVPGVGTARACQIRAALELGARAAVGETDPAGPVRTPPQAYVHLAHLARLDTEEMHVLALDARHRLITRFCVARGATNVVHVSPRDLYRRLIREGAVAGIVAHNHPTGDPVPSDDDLELTRRLNAAGELVGVSLLDHLIVGSLGYYSFTAGRTFHAPSPVGPG